MTIKSALSVFALVTAVSFGGAAYAQTMVGDNEVSETDLPIVQQHCDALSLADAQGTPAGLDPSDPAASTSGTTDEPTGAQADLDSRNSATTVDLDTITLEDCVAGGLVN
ncbi:hypothetical protein [Devosia chinhatensis]|uniref:Secreted protein n=1 Tax=Devosia chinhatensis TaxID=429727 RepID=A0A0F5FMH3_9HYPH|nr:hypothetical protein [Devosia chinhatensis]KKB10036.1 hypothetical protein VE26_09620 [Devosia chinhatensis]